MLFFKLCILKQDEELELASGCASSLDYRQLASTQDQFERESENGVTDRQSATSSIFTQVHIWRAVCCLYLTEL